MRNQDLQLISNQDLRKMVTYKKIQRKRLLALHRFIKATTFTEIPHNLSHVVCLNSQSNYLNEERVFQLY